MEVSYCTGPIVSSVPDTDGTAARTIPDSGSVYVWYDTHTVMFFFLFALMEGLISPAASMSAVLAIATATPFLRLYCSRTVNNSTSSADNVVPGEL